MIEVIIGADGYIGSKLAERLPGAIRTTRRPAYLEGDWPFDMEERGVLPDADIAYLCAGVNGTLTCARDPQGSYRVNVDGTIYVANRYRQNFLVWLSSTTVEWCSEAYAVQKRTAEIVLHLMPHVAIIRAGRVTNDNIDSLLDVMVKAGRGRISGLTVWNADERPYERQLQRA